MRRARKDELWCEANSAFHRKGIFLKPLANALQESAEINNLIQKLVHQVSSLSEKIQRPQPRQEDAAIKSAEQIQEVGRWRGRPLFYDYIGSGLGHGAYVELEDGSIKLDLINSIGVNILGHSHPRVIAASLRGALQDVVMQGNLQPNKEYCEFTRELVQIASRNSRLRHGWLATCGSMANENALKIARQKRTPARKILTMVNAFAGRSTMMAEITDNPDFKQGLPEYHEVLRVPFYDKKNPQSGERSLEIMKKHILENKGNICVFTFEPMQGEGGYRVANHEFFMPLLKLAREHQIPIWADEVQTFTRTGNFFAFETLGFGDYVDLCTIAKTAQNGATLYTPEMNPAPGLIAGTFSGSSASLSAGLETLRILDREDYMGPEGKVMQIHNEFIGMLQRLSDTTCKGLIQDFEGMGLMIAMTPLDGSKETQGKVLKTLFKNGLIAFGCGHDPYRVRFLVPAVITTKDIAMAGEIIEKTLRELSP
jgi:acetylornithine/N-succinyldiaminopimelate aminotransferase